MNTKMQLEAAQRAMTSAAEKVRELEARVEFENSFPTDRGTVHVLTRRDVDRGAFIRIEGVFATSGEANRYAKGLPGYGLGRDLFVDSFPLHN